MSADIISLIAFRTAKAGAGPEAEKAAEDALLRFVGWGTFLALPEEGRATLLDELAHNPTPGLVAHGQPTPAGLAHIGLLMRNVLCRASPARRPSA